MCWERLVISRLNKPAAVTSSSQVPQTFTDSERYFINCLLVIRLLPEEQPTKPFAWSWKPNLATAPLESENRSRAFHNLSEVFGERFNAPLLVRSRARGRFGTLAKARTNSGTTHWSFHARKEMGVAESNYCGVDRVVGRPGSGRGRDHLEERISSASDPGQYRCAAIPRSQPSQRSGIFLRRHE